MVNKKFMVALAGWKGYSKNELIQGKYRPVFGDVSIFASKRRWKQSSEGQFKFGKPDRVLVPLTVENLKKTRDFNQKYATWSEETKKQIFDNLTKKIEKLKEVV